MSEASLEKYQLLGEAKVAEKESWAHVAAITPVSHRAAPYRTTRAPPPAICFSTSWRVAIEVSPGVVEANAP